MDAQDEICKSVADKGGLELVMRFITTSREQNHKVMARSACILLIQVLSSSEGWYWALPTLEVRT